VVIWDKIIRRGESAVLDLKDTKAKYYFFDDGHGLRFVRTVVFLLHRLLCINLRITCIVPPARRLS